MPFTAGSQCSWTVVAPGSSFLQVWRRLEKGEERRARRALLHLGVAEALVASVVTPRVTLVMSWASPLILSSAFLPGRSVLCGGFCHVN